MADTRSRGRGIAPAGKSIDIDPVKCDAHGLCAELLPERITLDEWGYPLIDPTPVPAGLEDLARRAVSACPTLALVLRARQAGQEPPGGAGGAGAQRPGERRAHPGGPRQGGRNAPPRPEPGDERPYTVYSKRGRRR